MYFYSYAITEEEAYNEAEWIVEKLEEYGVQKKCKYIAYDFEVYNTDRAKGVSKEQIDSNCIEFLNYVYNTGYKPVLYGNKNYLTNIFSTEEIVDNVPDCMVWLAQYNTAPSYDGEYVMWQYTSSEKVDGIPERVDVNVLYF